MLNIAIKNLIIFVLVMLAFHYALKIKEPHKATETFLEPVPVNPATCKDLKPTSELDQYFGCKPVPDYKCQKNDIDALAKAVSTAPVQQQPQIVMDSDSQLSICGPPAPSGTTCDPAFKTPIKQELPIKSDCVLDQPNPNAFLMLREYENDNVINTGRWENLDLYDEFGEVFAEFSCDAYSG